MKRPAGPAPVPPPAPVRSVLSLWLVIHFGLLSIALSATVSLSGVQVRMLQIAAPYLAMLHLQLDQPPLAAPLTERAVERWEHRLQWRSDADSAADEPRWRDASLDIPGPRMQRRESRYLRSIAEAASREDTATASMLALPWVRRLSSAESGEEIFPRVAQVRIIAVPPRQVRSASASPEAAEPVERWRAAVVADGGRQRQALVTVGERRLNALGAPSE